MKNLVCILILTLYFPFLFSQNEKKPSIYKVLKTKNTIVIDGKLDDADWAKSDLRPFNYFYKKTTNYQHQKTSYRMLWDDKNLYLFFECEDTHIVAQETQRDGQPFFDDCAELFLIPAPKPLNVHIALEVNLYNAKNDILYVNDFEKGKDIVAKWYNPNYEVAYQIDGTLNDNSDVDKGWAMEFKIPFNILWGLDRAYPIQKGTKYRFLALRQDRNVLEAEDNKRAISSIFPINNIKEKGAHQPEMFGMMELVE